jgi:hypothetical protein
MSQFGFGACLRLMSVALGLSAAMPLRGATFVVTSLADSGPGTLLELINTAKNNIQNYNFVIITFAVGGEINIKETLLSACAIANCSGPHGPDFAIIGDGKITIRGGFSIVRGSDVRLSGLTFVSNGGRAIQNNGARTSISNCTFLGYQDAEGSAILNQANGILSVHDSTFQENSATGDGGALSNRSSTLSISSSTFDRNRVGERGGAVFSDASSQLSITNSTFYGNRASEGGAIFNQGQGQISFSTFAANGAVSGGTLFQDRSVAGAASKSLSLSGTIVANSASGGNCVCPIGGLACFPDGGANLSYPDNTCPGTVGDPKLGPLQANGGFTKTMALLANSAAIDVAPCGSVSVDQRGVQRPLGLSCDSGSYERAPFTFSGFQAPISSPPLINNVNAGRAIPVQFGIDGYQGMSILATNYPASQPVSCETALPAGDLVPVDIASVGLTYDAFSRTYRIVWKTDKRWENTCRQLVLRLTDKVDHVARFAFR